VFSSEASRFIVKLFVTSINVVSIMYIVGVHEYKHDAQKL